MTTDTIAPSHKDRHGGLIFFGILQIALGVLALLMCGLSAVSFLMVRNPPHGAAPMPPMPMNLLLLTVGAYLPAAVWFLVLGVATILPRRWAWALTLVVSWSWLVFGVMTSAVMLFMMNSRIIPAMPPGHGAARTFALGCMAAVLGVLFVVLPIAFVLFYRSPNVKATVWARDPRPRWTDDIPLTVLGGGILMIASAPMILIASASYKAMPIGNTLVYGWPALAILVAVCALSLFSGVQLLRLRPSGWWGTAAFIVISIAWGISFIGTDAGTWRAAFAINVPPEQFDAVAGMYRSPFFFGWMAMVWAAYAAFLFYVRRYFFGANSGDGPAATSA